MIRAVNRLNPIRAADAADHGRIWYYRDLVQTELSGNHVKFLEILGNGMRRVSEQNAVYSILKKYSARTNELLNLLIKFRYGRIAFRLNNH